VAPAEGGGVSASPAGGLPLDPGLLTRFRTAGTKIAWRDAPGVPPARVARLHDEEARVEERPGETVVESGPVGALVLLLELDRRGRRATLSAREASLEPGFPSGAIAAVWKGKRGPGAPLAVGDLVEVARYALV
jgi:hypothetical protein